MVSENVVSRLNEFIRLIDILKLIVATALLRSPATNFEAWFSTAKRGAHEISDFQNSNLNPESRQKLPQTP